jgi:hypothetical protein
VADDRRVAADRRDVVCRGYLAESDGWKPIEDLWRGFRETEAATYESQQLCSSADTSLNVVPSWKREKFVIIDYQPDPAHGLIFFGGDWGSTNPTSFLWAQLLRRPVEARLAQNGATITLPQGALVIFAEVYRANATISELSAMAWQVETRFKTAHEDWRVWARVHDRQGRHSAESFIRDRPWSPGWHPQQPRKDTPHEVRLVRERVSDGKLFVVNNLMLVQEFPACDGAHRDRRRRVALAIRP